MLAAATGSGKGPVDVPRIRAGARLVARVLRCPPPMFSAAGIALGDTRAAFPFCFDRVADRAGGLHGFRIRCVSPEDSGGRDVIDMVGDRRDTGATVETDFTHPAGAV